MKNILMIILSAFMVGNAAHAGTASKGQAMTAGSSYVSFKKGSGSFLTNSQKKKLGRVIMNGQCQTAIGCVVRVPGALLKVVWTGTFTAVGHAVYHVTYLAGAALHGIGNIFDKCSAQSIKAKRPGLLEILGIPCSVISAAANGAGDLVVFVGKGVARGSVKTGKIGGSVIGDLTKAPDQFLGKLKRSLKANGKRLSKMRGQKK